MFLGLSTTLARFGKFRLTAGIRITKRNMVWMWLVLAIVYMFQAMWYMLVTCGWLMYAVGYGIYAGICALFRISKKNKKTNTSCTNSVTSTPQPQPASNKNGNTEFLLCIFLGWMGAHRFYTKKYKSAVLYLLTGGAFLVGWFYDIASMVVARVDAKNGKTTPKYIPAIIAGALVVVLMIAVPSVSSNNDAKSNEPTQNAVEAAAVTDLNSAPEIQPEETQPLETEATAPSTDAVPELTAPSEETQPTEPEQTSQPETQPAELVQEETQETIPQETQEETQAVTQQKAPPETQPETEAPVAASSGTMVWIPESGSKYHSSPTCSGMENPTQVTLEQAIAWGYEPCKRCH